MSKQRTPFGLNDFLNHILEAIGRIENYTEGLGFSQFVLSTRDQDAVIRNLEVIGEASRNIERHFPSFVEEHSELPFRSASDMRNTLTHGYFGVDLAIVWQTIKSDLPALKKSMLASGKPLQ